eukprot:c27151_g1_i1 orf=140-352(+)
MCWGAPFTVTKLLLSLASTWCRLDHFPLFLLTHLLLEWVDVLGRPFLAVMVVVVSWRLDGDPSAWLSSQL